MSLRDAYNILCTISAVSVLIPLVLFMLRFKQLNRSYKILFFFLVFSAFTEVAARLFSGKISFLTWTCEPCYYALANLFTLVQFLSLIYVYYRELTPVGWKLVLLVSSVVFCLLTIFSWVLLRRFQTNDNITTVVEAIVFFTLSIAVFIYLLKTAHLVRNRDGMLMWFNSAVLVYFSVTVLLFAADDFLQNCTQQEFMVLWSLNLVANIVFNCFLSILAYKWVRLD